MATEPTAELTAPSSVFVTGATSPLGREVVRQLIAAGHTVTGATSDSAGATSLRAAGALPAYPNLMRAGELRSALQVAQAKILVNLAPHISAGIPHQRNQWETRLPVEGTQALVDAAKEAGIEYLLHTSYAFLDAAAHGETPAALTAFFLSVLSAERYIQNAGIPAGVLRLGYLYGPDSDELLGLRKTMQGGRPVVLGSDTARANWIHVADAARAIALAVQKRYTGETLNIVDNRLASPAEFLRYFAESQGLGISSLPGFASRLMTDKTQAALLALNSHADNRKAQERLGWSPRFSTFQEGIDDTLLSWRAQEPIRL